MHIVKDIITKTINNLCRKIFATFRNSKILVSDNAKTFTSIEFTSFLKINGITQKLITAYNPLTNGQAERFVQTLKNSLRRMRCNSSNVHIMLQQILIHRNTSHLAMGKSPAKLMFARKLCTSLDLLLPQNERANRRQVSPYSIRNREESDL